MFGESFIKRASAWYLDGAVIKPRTTGTSLEYDGGADIAGQLQGDLINNQMVSKATSDILGLMTDPRFLNLQCEDPGAGTLYDVSGQGHDGTYQGSMTTGDRVKKGMGLALDFDGSDDYVNLGDHNDFSFGDGTNDEAVTWFGVIEIKYGTYQLISTKWSGVFKEWEIFSTDIGAIIIRQQDESAGVYCEREIDSGLSEGWHTYVVTSPGDEGITAMNNVKIYIDGSLVASTPLNNGSYVAMENLSSEFWIGGRDVGGGITELPYAGDIALTGMDGSEWSAYDVHRFHQICKGLYGL